VEEAERLSRGGSYTTSLDGKRGDGGDEIGGGGDGDGDGDGAGDGDAPTSSPALSALKPVHAFGWMRTYLATTADLKRDLSWDVWSVLPLKMPRDVHPTPSRLVVTSNWVTH